MSHFVSPFNLVSTVFKVTTTQQQSHCERVFDMTARKVNKRIIFLYSSCSHHLPSLLVSIIIKQKNVKTYFSFLTSSPLMTQDSCADELPQFYWSLKNISESEHSKLFEWCECSGEWVCPRLGDDWLWAVPRSEDIVRMHGTDTVHTRDQRLSSQQITLRWSLHHLRNLNYNFAGNFILV